MEKMELSEATSFSCEVDSHNGIYSGQAFAERFEGELTKLIGEENVAILLAGPDNEDYVEVWANLFTNGVEFDGRTFFELEGDICSLSTDEYERIAWDSVC